MFYKRKNFDLERCNTNEQKDNYDLSMQKVTKKRFRTPHEK